MIKTYTLKSDIQKVWLSKLTYYQQTFGVNYFQLITQNRLDYFSDKQFVMTQEQYLKILSFIDKWNANQYRVPYGLKLRDCNILFQIRHINFENLTNLNLNNLNITSIQNLTYMNLLQLKQLNISSNFIINLKPLSHIYTPKLSSLNVTANYFRENSLPYLNRFKYNAPQFTSIYLQNQQDQEQKQIQNASDIFKFQANQIVDEIMQSKKIRLMMRNIKIQEIIIQKFNCFDQFEDIMQHDFLQEMESSDRHQWLMENDTFYRNQFEQNRENDSSYQRHQHSWLMENDSDYREQILQDLREYDSSFRRQQHQDMMQADSEYRRWIQNVIYEPNSSSQKLISKEKQSIQASSSQNEPSEINQNEDKQKNKMNQQ